MARGAGDTLGVIAGVVVILLLLLVLLTLVNWVQDDVNQFFSLWMNR